MTVGRPGRPGRRPTAILSLVLLLAAAPTALSHSPDPAIFWPLYTPDDVLEFRWREGEVPPAAMRTAIVAGANGANASRGSRAPTLASVAGGTSSVEYGANVFCGPNGLACADGSGAPNSFRVAFRTHGWQFDWGRLQWCQMQTSPTNGCYDVVNVALDEFGHILGLGHHVNFSDESDYLDAVVQTVSRARPKPGWNANVFGRCDTAKLQLRYDMVNSARKYSTCLDLVTGISLAVNDRAISLGQTVTFTAVVRTADSASYDKLRANFLSERRVVLERRVPGSTSWTQVAVMPAVGTGTYRVNISPTATYDWRGFFVKPSDEGLRASSSSPFTITVSGGCQTSPCPQSIPAESSVQEAIP